jgi:hypothetical protein
MPEYYEQIADKTIKESTDIYVKKLPNIFITVLDKPTRKFRFDVLHYAAFR